MNAPFGSGTRSMSDSWISWNPRIEEPSKPNPSWKLLSSSCEIGTEKCCHSPGRSQNRRSTISAPASFASASASLASAIGEGSLRVGGTGGSLVRSGCSRVSAALIPRYARGPGRGSGPAAAGTRAPGRAPAGA